MKIVILSLLKDVEIKDSFAKQTISFNSYLLQVQNTVCYKENFMRNILF